MLPIKNNLYGMVDFHGLSAEQAQDAVNYWLSTSGSKGMNHIRFVTGRGNHLNAKGERGTLYKNFLNNIEASPYKDRVESCSQHDGYFEVTLKSTQKSSLTMDSFEKMAKDLMPLNIEIIKAYAEKGEAYFQMEYGKLIEEGKYVKQDFKQAVELYRLAAANDYPPAMHELARCYLHGVGVRQSDEQAVEWLKKADQAGYIESTVSLGDSYFWGHGVKEDDKVAICYYAKAAARKHPTAMRKLANAYNTGQGIAKNIEIAFRWYKSAADLGDIISQYNVGIMYHNELCVKKNNEEAWRYLHLAGNGGDPDAQYYIGLCYLNGSNIKQDENQAIVWLKKAADNGSLPALHQLSNIGDKTSRTAYLKKSADGGNFIDKMRLYAENGQLEKLNEEEFGKLLGGEIKKYYQLPINEYSLLDHDMRYVIIDWMLLYGKTAYRKKALIILEMLAGEKCIFSLRRLYMIYSDGFAPLQIKKDFKKAIAYLQQAVDLNDSKAMLLLGNIYFEGKGVKKSPQQALMLYQKAIEQLNPTACHILALLHKEGELVAEDLAKAQEYAVQAIVFEKKDQESSRRILCSGLWDVELSITEDALALLDELELLEKSKYPGIRKP